MAMFIHKESPTYGACTTCGTSSNVDGFVDLIAEVDIVRENNHVVGNIDVVICATCLTQAARAVGCIPADQADAQAQEIFRLNLELNKTADEASAWHQRYENMVEIVSMIQLNGRDDNSEYLATGGATGISPEPSPDTRIQEGRELASASNGKAKPGRPRKGAATN